MFVQTLKRIESFDSIIRKSLIRNIFELNYNYYVLCISLYIYSLYIYMLSEKLKPNIRIFLIKPNKFLIIVLIFGD